ncbi:hypothetical protein [Flavobacterium sp. SM2513]|uniref:hypothetical protein n=1 Tax=Flavobacterium sp. SM2513 TaxID=3424766 RepID=UPI003D7F49ED
MSQEIIEAIENKNLIEFNYDGESRIVAPHCYGLSTKGNEVFFFCGIARKKKGSKV